MKYWKKNACMLRIHYRCQAKSPHQKFRLGPAGLAFPFCLSARRLGTPFYSLIGESIARGADFSCAISPTPFVDF